MSNKKVFKTPMKYEHAPPEGGRPSQSRSDIWREELGLDEQENGRTESDSDSGAEPEADRNYSTKGFEFLLLQKEIADRNKERDGLMEKLNKLRESYHDSTLKLQKSENVRRQHMSMIKKTYEAQLEEKRAVIANLEDIVSQQEEKINELESGSGETTVESETVRPVNAVPDDVTNGDDVSKNQIQEMMERFREMGEQYNELEQHCQELKSSLEKQKRQYQSRDVDYRAAIEHYQNEIIVCKQKIKTYEKQLQSYPELETRWTELVKQNHEMSNQLTSLQQKHPHDETDSKNGTEYEKRIQVLQTENSHVTAQLKALRSHADEMSKNFESEMEEARNENEAMGTRIVGLNQRIAEMEGREPEVVTQYEKVEVESEELRAALEVSETSNNELTGHITSLRTTCRQHEEARHLMDDEIVDLEQKLNQQNRELQEIEASYQEQLEDLHHRSQRKLQQSYQVYAKVQKISVQVNQEVQSLSKDFRALKQMCSQFPVAIKQTIKGVAEEMGAALSTVSEREEKLLQSLRKEIYNRNKYRDQVVALKGNIRVFTRVRPLIPEDGGGPSAARVVDSDLTDDSALTVRYKNRPQPFSFDRVFMMNSTQDEVFSEAEAMVTCSLDGYNVCIFAYGQTGSGKTYTMEGTPKNPGLNRRALTRLFEIIEDREETWDYQVTVSYLEIYNETLRDLLVSDSQQQKLEMKMRSDGQIHVPGLTVTHVHDFQDVQELFRIGLTHRATASTALNKQSSRSHALLCVRLHGTDRTNGTRVQGKLNLIDLAGSERVKQSGVDGARLREAQCINKSLSTLGDVIHALRNNQSHVPYRNSKLTYLLHDSLGGESKTLMIAQCTPIERHVAETLCTLTFGQRCRQVQLGTAKRKVQEKESVKKEGNVNSNPLSPRTGIQSGIPAQKSRGYPSALI